MPALLLIVAALVVVAILVKLATDPIGALLTAALVVSFLVAAGFWIAFIVGLNLDDSGAWGFLAFAVPASIIWVLLVRYRNRTGH